MKTLAHLARQIFPLTYRSRYSDSDGNRRFAVWKMWGGKVYRHEDFVLAG
jgi:hypothetical protein